MSTKQPEVALSGVWRNQLGTVLRLNATADGRLEGCIESVVGGVAGAYPLTGFSQPGDRGAGVLGFVVAFGGTRSVTSWCGRYGSADGTISVLWILSEQGEGANEWQATRIGHDTFVPETADLAGVPGEGGPAGRSAAQGEGRVA